MPVPIKKGKERAGRKPSCTCGLCSKCQTRRRVEKWREEQKDLQAKAIGKILESEKREYGD